MCQVVSCSCLRLQVRASGLPGMDTWSRTVLLLHICTSNGVLLQNNVSNRWLVFFLHILTPHADHSHYSASHWAPFDSLHVTVFFVKVLEGQRDSFTTISFSEIAEKFLSRMVEIGWKHCEKGRKSLENPLEKPATAGRKHT